MRFLPLFITSLLAVNCLQLHAAFEDSVSMEEQIEPADFTSQDPFTIQTSFDYIGYSHMEKEGYKCTKIRYNQLNILGRMVFYYNPCCCEGVSVSAGYTRDQIYWFDNPYFNQVNFNTADLFFTFFTKRLHDWLWTMEIGAGYDTDRNDFTEATAWDVILWGRYERSRCLGLHIGFLAQTGMRIDHVYPIIGFDYKFRGPWKLNVIYPVNISVLYEIDCNWSAGIASRFFDSRHRLSRDDITPHGLVTYRATGAEFRINYQYDQRLSANIHGGGTFGGELKVANHKYRNKKHFKFESAPYAGGELEFNF